MDRSCKILEVWLRHDVHLENNRLVVLEKVMAAFKPRSQRKLSLKGRAEVCISHIYPVIFNRLSILFLSAQARKNPVRIYLGFHRSVYPSSLRKWLHLWESGFIFEKVALHCWKSRHYDSHFKAGYPHQILKWVNSGKKALLVFKISR